jgi:hypothetical protein
MKKRGGGTVFKRESRKASNDPRISPSLLTAVFSIKLLVVVVEQKDIKPFPPMCK